MSDDSGLVPRAMNDEACRNCGSYGHFTSSCPRYEPRPQPSRLHDDASRRHDAETAAQAIRDALHPRVPNEHHSRCASHRGEECDCYAKKSNAAFDALASLDLCLTEQEHALVTFVETCRDRGRGDLNEVAYVNKAAKDRAIDCFDRQLDHIIGFVLGTALSAPTAEDTDG